MTTGLMWDERCMWHNSGLHFGPSSRWVEPIPHPENADGKRRIKNLLDASGLTGQLLCPKFDKATEKHILSVHSSSYISEVLAVSEAGGGNLAKRLATTHIGEHGIDVALLAAGGAISAVTSVLDGKVENAYALIRPPGHHAVPNEAMGFCVFANAALAGKYALENYGLDRIAFVDWDVHHGNGTEAIFFDDPRAYTISIHQDNCFPPNSGSVDQIGIKDGKGTNLNIPLPPGSGEPVYLAAFDRIVKPALELFKPQLIIVPCGFDAGFHDPLGRMMLTSHSFRRLTARIMEVASKLCGGKLVLTHEGGYSPHTVPFHCLAVIEQLSGITTEVVDPFSPPVTPESDQPLLDHQERAIMKAENLIN